jgi:hypothetical protein
MDYSKLDQFEDIGKSLIDGMIFCGCKRNFNFRIIKEIG